MHVHRVAEAPDDAFRTQTASLVFIRIASLRHKHLLIVHRHAAAAHPVLAVARVNMVEVRQTRKSSIGDDLARITDRLLAPASVLARSRFDLINWNFHTRSRTIMAKVCEVCGRGPQFGNRVSHAHNVTKRRWNVNLQAVRAVVNGASRRLRVCTSCIRSGKVQKVA